MKKKKKWLFVGGGTIILIIFVILALSSSRSDGIKVTVEKAQRGDITSIVTATGKVKAQSEVKISADVMGRIDELSVKEGQYIKKGALLVKIDSRSREMDVIRAQGSLASALSNLEVARLEWEREKQLHEKNLSSQAALDLKFSSYKQAEAQVKIAEADLDRTQDQLEKCTIKSPIDGIITQLNSEEGENVVIGTMNAAGTVIMVISDLSTVEIEAEVDETDIALVDTGQEVKISIDAFPDTTFQGKVIHVGNSATVSQLGYSDQVTNFMVRVLIVDFVKDIKPGMTASVDITTAHHTDIIKIPSGAVVMRPEGTGKSDIATEKKPRRRFDKEGSIFKKNEKEVDGVFLVNEGKTKFIKVKTGISDQQYVEITQGLSESDSVITGPYRMLRTIKHGQKIIPERPKFGPDEEMRSSTVRVS